MCTFATTKSSKMEPKKLYLSKTDKKLCGVCAGIAEYFELDPTIIRLLWVVLTFCSFGTALIAYFICALIIPKQP
jgi:phage shock protein C